MHRAAPRAALVLPLPFPLAMPAGHPSHHLNVSSSLLSEGRASAWIGGPAAVAASSLAALAIGAVSLRTRGVYFIMITLAFAQMMFFLVNSMKAYGGDEGLSLRERASAGLGIDLGNDVAFYYTALAALAVGLYCLHRLAPPRLRPRAPAHPPNTGSAPASRTRRRRAREPRQVREPERGALDAVGHAHGDGDHGRRGTALGRGDRRGGAARARGPGRQPPRRLARRDIPQLSAARKPGDRHRAACDRALRSPPHRGHARAGGARLS